jgi:hypothetical protein
MVDRVAWVTRQTVAKGISISAPTSAASVAASGASFFGHLLPDLILQGQLADLALGIPESSVLLGGGPPALRAVLAGVQELVPPGGQPVSFGPHLPAHLLELLAPQQAKHHVQLLARLPPILRPEVIPSSFTVMRAILAPLCSVSNFPGCTPPRGSHESAVDVVGGRQAI